ncbi:MAG: sensor histidine kinase [Schwartzia sp. (in: firmicutes)]
MSTNVFRHSRWQLTLYYSIIMAVFLGVFIFLMHFSMKWAVSSEQAQELMDMAKNVAAGQAVMVQHPELHFDDGFELKGYQDRLFFYVFDTEGRMMNFSRASFSIEPFVLSVISDWKGREDELGDVAVFSQPLKHTEIRVMMAAHPIVVDEVLVGTVYVGKEISAVYRGLQKATYTLTALAVLALLMAAGIGYAMAGKALVPLKEAYEKQRQFAADASHELRTPLSVVLASAEVLESDPSIQSPFLKQIIGDIHDEVTKMTKLVSDLLVVARSDNEALKLKLTKVDLAAAADQTMRLMQPLAEKKRLTLKREGAATLSTKVDEQKMKQLMLILVDNAVKYTPEGGAVTVRLTEPAAGKILFAVEDTGIGIAPEDQARIFDRFYRVDKARSREMGGNGLGLAIAREIVHLHGGTIKVMSRPGEGTTFTVALKRLS